MSTALSIIGGMSAPVDRRTYAWVGFGLMLVKYAVEAAAVALLAGSFLSPLEFLTPLVSVRAEVLRGGPPWSLLALATWTLPFAWVGATMTIRRAVDGGLPAWVGLLFFVPILNFLVMFLFCALPTRGAPIRVPLQGEHRRTGATLIAVSTGAAFGLAVTVLSVFGLQEYGAGLFVGTPFVTGAVAGFLLNLRGDRGARLTWMTGVVTVLAAGGLLLLFALEGVLCLAMALPLAAPLGIGGALVGRWLARVEARRALLAPFVALPLQMVLEPGPATVHEVATTIEIDAPIEVVWSDVIGFGGAELDPPPEWFFRLGIAYPVRARIDGSGVGAVRRCEFSTGPFVEPITAWDEPSRLAFDVTSSPPTMHEWSPWEQVHAPHLDGILQSRRGEFLIEDLGDGRTRLTGTTWYTFDMAPEAYWSLWSDAAIHRIHLRVLEHVRRVSEGR